MSAEKPENRLFLRKLRVKNYKCLEKIDISFRDLTLLAGKNGAGKSAVFEVLDGLHRFVARDGGTGETFPAYTVTRWGGENVQAFQLELSNSKEKYRYHLTLSHERGSSPGVLNEMLFVNGKEQFPVRPIGDMVHLPDRSRVRSECANPKARLAQKFLKYMEGIVFLSPSPFDMRKETGYSSNAHYLDSNGANFASWYLTLRQENMDWPFEVRDKLREVLPGFRELNKIENGHKLMATFQLSNDVIEKCPFNELSSGQCVLIALYTLVFGDENRLLLLDEPDNFVMLQEIQPLLSEMECEAAEELPQIALISHHPEAIDFISPEESVWLTRNDKGASAVKKFKNNTMLHTSELYARGAAP